MPAGDIYAIGMGVRLGQTASVNVLHLRQKNTGPDETNREMKIRDGFLNSQIPNTWLNAASDRAELFSLSVYRIFPTRGFPATFSIGPFAGNTASESLPLSNAAQAMWYTDTFNRSGVGRKYWAGIPLSGVQNGVLLNAQLLLYGSLQNEFKVDIADSAIDWEWGVWSTKLSSFGVYKRTIISPVVVNHRGRKAEV